MPAPLDEEFAKSFGIADGNLDSLRTEVRANMERELNEAIRQKMRAQVLEGLYTHNPLELPRQMVEETDPGIAGGNAAPCRRARCQAAAAARAVRAAGAPPRRAGPADERAGAQRRTSR